MDNLSAINDGEFGRSNPENHLKTLELKLEHQGTHASFSNCDISIVDGKFVYKLNDERDSLPFFNMRMLHIDSNIPNNIFYSVFAGETLRIDCSTIFFSDFLGKDQELVSRILRQDVQVQKSHSFSKKL